MRLNIKYLMFVISIMMITLVSSANPSMGIYKLYDLAELPQLCNINGTMCDTCNITSIEYPNGTRAVNDVTMEKREGDFNYTFSFARVVGRYDVNGYCTYGSDVRKPFVAFFDVTTTGKDMTTSKAIIYILVFVVTCLILIGLLVLGIFLPASNKKDEMTGYILAINNLKYVKILSLCFAYLTALFISFYAYVMTRAYLDLNFLTNTLRFIFIFFLATVLPFFALMVWILISNAVRDSKVGELLSRGLKIK